MCGHMVDHGHPYGILNEQQTVMEVCFQTIVYIISKKDPLWSYSNKTKNMCVNCHKIALYSLTALFHLYFQLYCICQYFLYFILKDWTHVFNILYVQYTFTAA